MMIMITTAFQFFTVLFIAAAFAALAVAGTTHALTHFGPRLQRRINARDDQT